MNIVYPPGAFQENGGPVINIKTTSLFSPNAVGNGVTDDTAAFVAMMDYIKGRLAATGKADPRVTIYMPSGTYLVSDTIIHTGSVSGGFCFLRLVGQDRNNTKIRLKNNSAGFGAGQQKSVITWTKYWESYRGNVMWGNQLRNVTIDTGSGNPGAVGMAFFGANGCSIDNVTIRSGDGTGNTGLLFPGWSVQGHFSDITVEGFDHGVRLTDDRETNPSFEYLTLKNQNVCGLTTGPAVVTVRKLLSQNSVTAISVNSPGSQTVVLDSRLEGGAPGEAAVQTIASNQINLFMRNVQVAGYGASVNINGTNVLSGNVNEWLNGEVFSINSSTPPKTMNLPVEEVSLVPWESNPNNWASPEDYSGTVTQRIQAAMDSGKPAVYFPKAYNTGGSTIIVPTTVRQIEFLHQTVDATTFRINQAGSQDLWVEHPQRRLPIHVNAPRTIHVRFGSVRYRALTSEPVTAHFQTMAVLADGHRDDFCPPNVKMYNRSPNEESPSNTNFKINGGLMWVTGYKTERPRPAFEVTNGGFLEVLGGYQNFAGTGDEGYPVVLNNNSNVSYIGSSFMSRTYWEGIWEIRDGVTTKIRNPDFPRRVGFHSGNYTVPLYVGYDPALLPGSDPLQALIHETFDADSAVSNQATLEQVFLVNEISGNKWNHTTSGGAGNSGRLSAPTGQNASVVHKTALPGFSSGGTFAVSLDTLISYRTSNEPTFAISWWAYLKDGLTAGNGGLVVELRYIPPASRSPQNPERFQVLANGVVIATPNFTSDHWYGWEVTWTLANPATSAFDVSVHVFDLGTDGTGSPSISGTYSRQNIVSSTMANSNQIHAGFQGRARNGTGVFALDNFTVGDEGNALTAVFQETFDAGSSVTHQTNFEQVFLINEISGNQWNHTTSGGTGNSGRISAPAGQNVSAVHKSAISGFGSGGPLTLSLDTFIGYRTSNEPTFAINWWVFAKNNLSAGNGGLVVELRYIPPANRTPQNPERFQLLANGSVIATPNFTNDHWYGWEVTWTLASPATSSFDVSVHLFDLGPDGTGTPSTVGSYSRQNIIHSTMAGASEVYGGIQGRARDDTGVFRLDNFAAGKD